MASDYLIPTLMQPLQELSNMDLAALQQELHLLTAEYLTRVPRYQVFLEDIEEAFGDKHLVVVREHDKLIAFVSAVSIFAKDVYPSPSSNSKNLNGQSALPTPSKTLLFIASEINARYPNKMLISPDATFDSGTFVFRASNDHDEGRVFMKDVDDKQYWHRNEDASRFYRQFFRKNRGDEFLQIGFISPAHLKAATASGKHARQFQILTAHL